MTVFGQERPLKLTDEVETRPERWHMFQILFFAVNLLAGIPFGLLLKTPTERKLRGNIMPWLPFGSSSLPWLILGILVKTILLVPIFFTPMYLVSEAGRYLTINYDQRLILFLYLIGVLIGKGIRYAYWRRRDEWA